MTPAQRIEGLFHDHIPLSRAMGVKVASYDAGALTLSAPLSPNHNHLGTAFGGSLAALATLSGYGWLWLELDNTDCHIVIRESSISYLQPVRGELRAVCPRPAEEAVAKFRRDFQAKQKARITLESTVWEGDIAAVRFTGVFVALA